MESYSFLGAVARAYISRYDRLSDICFVFPNKRSRSFFLKNLTENIGDKVMLAPVVLDISEFMDSISGLEEASRIDLLFRLYNVYCNLSGLSDNLETEKELLNFDRFSSWGEVILGDLDEVEQYCVDAGKLFTNVRDYRNIASNFLNEDQIEIIERYFGYRPLVENAEGFWKSVYDVGELSKLKEKFIELWRLLPELYEGLIENLKKDGLAMPGTSYREAAAKIMAHGRDILPWKKVVMVGFNMLSTSETQVFEALRDMKTPDGEPYAEFFWDATGPVLGPDSKSGNRAAAAMRRYRESFPMPEWARDFIRLSNVDSMPDITISAAPSNVAQTKIASLIVDGWVSGEDPKSFRDADAAIVVPDENLLLPLLHSLPERLDNVNLTMGYSMRFTAVASFMYHLKRLQIRRRKTGGEIGYYHEDLRMFLAHPLVHAMIGSETANDINTEMNAKHLRVVTPAMLGKFSTELESVLQPVPSDFTAVQTIGYLDDVLASLDRALRRGNEGNTLNSKMELTQVATYRGALVTLLNSVVRHGISMGYMNVFHLVDRLVAGEKVNFEGKPLVGLQVMGLLETRAIDFDHVIVLSMNDKIMPRSSRRRTFIPDALRRAYGLPTSSKSEELYSYYFYRLLSRARDVSLIYDARAGEGMRSGGKSRFLMQLEMLYARGRVKKENFTFSLGTSDPSPEGVEKTPEVKERLSLYFKENGKKLSASALMDYGTCQVKFYYKNVVGIKDDYPVADYIDPIALGDIVHDAMLELYFPEGKRNIYLEGGERITLTPEYLRMMLDDPDMIASAVRHSVNRKHFGAEGPGLEKPLTGTVAMVAERIENLVRSAVEHDMGLAPFELVGGEVKGRQKWKIGNAPEVTFSYAFDRVDRVDGKLRIVDYKTGASGLDAGNDFENIFNGSKEAKYALQMLLYSHLLDLHYKGTAGDVEMHIYDLNTLGAEGSKVPRLEKKEILSQKDISTRFVERLEKMISEIFDDTTPFVPAEDTDKCKYCAYQALCGRK